MSKINWVPLERSTLRWFALTIVVVFILGTGLYLLSALL